MQPRSDDWRSPDTDALLDAGLHYSEISRRTGASTATITRIASWLRHGEGGYAIALEKARARGTVYPEAPAHQPTGQP